MGRTESRSVCGWIGRRLSRWSRHAGFSLAETTIILSAASVLTATAAPSVMDYVAQARGIKASGDVQVLTTALARLLFDVGQFKAADASQAPELLVGPGAPAVAGNPNADGWTAPLDGSKVQNMVDHLMTNAVGYPLRGGGSFAKGWAGPYVDMVPTDPWGQRYGVNVGGLGTGTAVIVLSAGPNRMADTPFHATGFQVGGDDIIGLLGTRR